MQLVTAGWQVGVVTLPLSAVMVVLPGLFCFITLLVLSYLAWGELAHPELVGWYRRHTTTLNHSHSVGILRSLYPMPSVDDPYAQRSTLARLFGSSPKRRWGMAASLCLALGLVPAWGQLGCWTVSVPVWTSGALLLTSPTLLWIMLVFGAPSVVWRRWSLGTCLLGPVACLGLPLLSVLLHGLAMLDPGVIKLLVILVVMALLPTSRADPTGGPSGASTFTKAVTNATAPPTPASANSWLEWTGLTPGRMASYLLDRVISTTSALFQGLVSTMGAVLAPEWWLDSFQPWAFWFAVHVGCLVGLVWYWRFLRHQLAIPPDVPDVQIPQHWVGAHPKPLQRFLGQSLKAVPSYYLWECCRGD